MIDLNTCQPGQQLIRRDGLRAEYVGLNVGDTLVYRHEAIVHYHAQVKAIKHFMDNGKFISGSTTYEGDIIEILPMPTDDYKWSAKISDDHVHADNGFWAVYQGEVS